MTEKNNTKENIDIAIIEIKLAVNKNLYEKGFITEEMYTKAKEMILKS